jgi:hypothetical protein
MAVRKRSPRKKTARKVPAKPRNRGGRPRKVISDLQLDEIRRLGRVLSQEQIAAYLGIAPNTFAAILERQPEVFEALKKGRAEAISEVGRGLLLRALEGDTASAIFYLKTQAGWTERRDVRIEATATADAARGKLAALLRLEPDEAEDAGE